ncbi:unknown [Prevotella sp. CAG:487]|nr:unknown [Prevotella sp. CAG:487]
MVAYHLLCETVPRREHGQPSALLILVDERLHHVARQTRAEQRDERMEGAERVPQTEVVIIGGMRALNGLSACERGVASVGIAHGIGAERGVIERRVELHKVLARAALSLQSAEMLLPYTCERGAYFIETPSGILHPHVVAGTLHVAERRRHLHDNLVSGVHLEAEVSPYVLSPAVRRAPGVYRPAVVGAASGHLVLHLNQKMTAEPGRLTRAQVHTVHRIAPCHLSAPRVYAHLSLSFVAVGRYDEISRTCLPVGETEYAGA